jgi:hypothetical protein
MMVCCFGQMWAMSSKFFVDVPYDLLLSCIEHPLLTVDRLINYFLKCLDSILCNLYGNSDVSLIIDSEMHLSDALLVWVDAYAKQLENFSRTGEDCHGIFRQVSFDA